MIPASFLFLFLTNLERSTELSSALLCSLKVSLRASRELQPHSLRLHLRLEVQFHHHRPWRGIHLTLNLNLDLDLDLSSCCPLTQRCTRCLGMKFVPAARPSDSLGARRRISSSPFEDRPLPRPAPPAAPNAPHRLLELLLLLLLVLELGQHRWTCFLPCRLETASTRRSDWKTALSFHRHYL